MDNRIQGTTARQIADFGTGGSIANNTTTYLGLTFGSSVATEAQRDFYTKTPFRVRNLNVDLVNNSLNDALVITIRKNGGASALTVTYGAGVTDRQSDTSNVVSYDIDDRINVELNASATSSGTASILKGLMEFEV